jgi:hypothetical protein
MITIMTMKTLWARFTQSARAVACVSFAVMSVLSWRRPAASSAESFFPLHSLVASLKRQSHQAQYDHLVTLYFIVGAISGERKLPSPAVRNNQSFLLSLMSAARVNALQEPELLSLFRTSSCGECPSCGD